MRKKFIKLTGEDCKPLSSNGAKLLVVFGDQSEGMEGEEILDLDSRLSYTHE